MEVKNEITMKFDELKEFIVAVEMNHFRGNNEGKSITKEFDRLIKQVEDCIYLNYKIGDKVITVSNYGKYSKKSWFEQYYSMRRILSIQGYDK